MDDAPGTGARVAASIADCASVCSQVGSDACCASYGCAVACKQIGQLHVEDADVILLDTCNHGPGPRLPNCAEPSARAYGDMRTLCAAHGGPWCAYVDAVRQDRAWEPALAVAMVIATACAIAMVRRRAAQRAARASEPVK